MQRPNNVIKIPPLSEEDFFRCWFEFLNPFHHLMGKELNVMTNFAIEYVRLSKIIHDEDILGNTLFSKEVTDRIAKKSNVSSMYLRNIVNQKLRKRGLFTGKKINRRYIPNYNGENNFGLYIVFDINGPQKTDKQSS